MAVMKTTIIMILCWPSPVCHEEIMSFVRPVDSCIFMETNAYGFNVTIPVYLVICMHLYHQSLSSQVIL